MLSRSLVSELGERLAGATNEDNTGKRTDLLNRYLAEPYGDEVDGRSKFLDSSAQDAVEAILPEVMDVFTSAPDLLEFEPVGQEDVDAAKQETAAVSHIFWQKNQGFLVLYTWLKEAMIQQNSYVWHGWVEKEERTVEAYEDLTFDEYIEVLSQFDPDEYEIEEQEGVDVIEDEETGAEMTVPALGDDLEPMPISVKLRCTKRDKVYRVEPFPQEDFFVTPRWHSLSLDGVPVCGRRHRDKTEEDWLAFGFSEDSVKKLNSGNDDEEETAARHHTKNLSEEDDEGDSVELYEVYANLDLKGDGIPQLVRIWCTKDAGVIMDWADGSQAVDEVNSIPIKGLTPYIMPHRHIGQSVVEKVEGIQQVKTILIRQMLDNTYLTNYPRPIFNADEEGQDTVAALANPAPGAPIPSRAGIEWASPPAVAATVLPLLEKFDNLQEVRTGATRYNQGLDAQSLNKTATGISRIMGASQKKAKLIARTFAETGLRELFLGIHADLRKGPVKEMTMRLMGQWTPVNPRTWKHRADMVVNVGMGRGDKDERRIAYQMAGQVQRELIAAGSRMVDEQKLFNIIDDTLDTFGISATERYFNDPATTPAPPPQPPQPDPIQMQLQMQAQIEAQKLQAQEAKDIRAHEAKMAELRLREIELTIRIQDDQERLDLEARKAVMADDLERDKMAVQGASAVPYGQVTGSNQ